MYAELERNCRTCEKNKPINEFFRISKGKRTTQPDCKSCRSYKEFVRGLMRNYGMTVSTYNEMLKKQNHCCACCDMHKSEFKRRLHVDHDHTTGQIRSLLCTRCNPVVGFVKEDITILDKIAVYISNFKKTG